ncbi:P-loop containing nucleoside triphosphate hydrolase protein [Choiromyces venosus 120613-1]|uniref:P-loop containing nucleoside triphosphate hydrolase protein n=1 Tax=Choiromyces venosus 120613-1 TaxID=1336337 RepID=A0A3N4K389_9PEZI|nr:P-loop containing nucleoside triphosphate hydrolase protein [Choiromyces venosus 120613-1]
MRGLGIDLNTATAAVMISTVLITCYNLSSSTISWAIDKYYTASVRINSEDALFRDFFIWLAEEQTEELDLSRVFNARKTANVPGDLDSGSPMGEEYYGGIGNVRGKPIYRVQYLPAVGSRYYLRYRGHKIRILMDEVKDSITMHRMPLRKIIWLRSYGRDPRVLKELLEEVLSKSNARDQGKTIVFHATMSTHGMPPRWERALARPNRSMETVILDGAQKELIIRDIEEYILPATAKWYANRGLPYRRGYLLYGPPGTGKTSLSMALAGHFNLEVYALSLSAGSLTDDTLASLFALLPSECIVLLEDVDASNVKRTADPTATPTTDMPSSLLNSFAPSHTPSSKPSVSFSGLLNAIDGAASREGRILIMTTNHRERLDPALIRPGRVDLQISFEYATRQVIESLFLNLYDVDIGDREALRMPDGFPPVERILELAGEFGRALPEGVFTPAEIQGLLLMHKKDPVAAVAAAGEWARGKRGEKGVEVEVQEAETEGVEGVENVNGVSHAKVLWDKEAEISR